MKNILILAIFLAGGIIASFIFFPRENPIQSITLPTKIPTQPTQERKITPVIASPTRIKIPKLAVDAEIEEVGTDSEGRMDIPKDYNNTGWYSPGTKPGHIGSAVIDGHVDTPEGKPSVFASIDTLFPGDKIIVSDAGGHELTFEVVKSEDYPLEHIPLEEIFRNDINESRLNLVTCSGAWDSNEKIYKNRFVVYSKLVEKR